MPNAILNKRVVGNPYPNQAVQFVAASSQSFSITDNASVSLGADTDHTIGAWVWLDSKTTTMGILSKWTGGSATLIELHLRYDTGVDRFRAFLANGTTSASVNANNFGAVATGGWNFVLAYHDSVGDVIGIQVNDGTANTAVWAGGTQDAANAFVVGGSTTSANMLDGRVDSAFYYKRLLTAAERTQLYKGGIGMAYRDLSGSLLTTLTGWWNFDGNGNDASGNGNHLTNNNGATFAAGKR